MAIRNPNLDEDIKGYDELQTAEVNIIDSRTSRLSGVNSAYPLRTGEVMMQSCPLLNWTSFDQLKRLPNNQPMWLAGANLDDSFGLPVKYFGFVTAKNVDNSVIYITYEPFSVDAIYYAKANPDGVTWKVVYPSAF